MAARWNPRVVAVALFAAVASCTVGKCCSLSADDERRIDAYLECIECTEGQLDSVVALAARCPGVVEALKQRLKNGPPPARRQVLAEVLGKAFVRDTSYALHHGTVPMNIGLADSATHVRQVAERLTIAYRTKAARALGCVAGSNAASTLQAHEYLDSLPVEAQDRIKHVQDSTANAGAQARFCRPL